MFIHVFGISGPLNNGKEHDVGDWGDKVSDNGLISGQSELRHDHWHQKDEDEVEAHLESHEGQHGHWEGLICPEFLEVDGF